MVSKRPLGSSGSFSPLIRMPIKSLMVVMYSRLFNRAEQSHRAVSSIAWADCKDSEDRRQLWPIPLCGLSFFGASPRRVENILPVQGIRPDGQALEICFGCNRGSQTIGSKKVRSNQGSILALQPKDWLGEPNQRRYSNRSLIKN